MTTPEAISCSLSAGELGDRLSEIAAIGAAGLEGFELRGRVAELRFSAAVRERVDAVLAAEQRCCRWLGVERRGERVLLSAPADGEAALGELVRAFAGAAPR